MPYPDEQNEVDAMEERLSDILAKQLLFDERQKVLVAILDAVLKADGKSFIGFDSLSEAVDQNAKQKILAMLGRYEDMDPALATRIWNLVNRSRP